MRASATAVLSVQVAALPIVPLHTAVAAGTEDEPPSMPLVGEQPVSGETLTSLALVQTADGPVAVNPAALSLAPVQIGESRSDEAVRIAREREEAERRQREEAEEAARKAEEQRQAALNRQRQQASAAQAYAKVGASSSEAIAYLHDRTVARLGADAWPDVLAIVLMESGGNPNAVNPRSGACGMFQALPCRKMGGMSLENQVNWGLGYIQARYHTASQALKFKRATGWY